MRLTRRELGTALVAGVAAAQSSLPPNPEAELLAAREHMKAMVARLAAQPVPMATEPAFQFKA